MKDASHNLHSLPKSILNMQEKNSFANRVGVNRENRHNCACLPYRNLGNIWRVIKENPYSVA